MARPYGLVAIVLGIHPRHTLAHMQKRHVQKCIMAPLSVGHQN